MAKVAVARLSMVCSCAKSKKLAVFMAYWKSSLRRITMKQLAALASLVRVCFRLLKLALDNVVYRLGFGASRKEARQLVRHSHFTVNGRRVNIPSYQVKVGDVVAIRETSQGVARIKELLESRRVSHGQPWLELDLAKFSGKVLRLPTREEIDAPVAEQMIVEHYSR